MSCKRNVITARWQQTTHHLGARADIDDAAAGRNVRDHQPGTLIPRGIKFLVTPPPPIAPASQPQKCGDSGTADLTPLSD